LAALGGVAGYYYNSTQTFKTKTVTTASPKKKDIDYQKIYNEIADMLDEDSE
jgi:cytochrome c peroxidase